MEFLKVTNNIKNLNTFQSFSFKKTAFVFFIKIFTKIFS